MPPTASGEKLTYQPPVRVGTTFRYDWARAAGAPSARSAGNSRARRILLTLSVRRERCARIGTNLLIHAFAGARRRRRPEWKLRPLGPGRPPRSEVPGREIPSAGYDWQSLERTLD